MRWLSLAVCCLASWMTLAPLSAGEAPLYELRVYTCSTGKLDALNSRFREHTMKLFEKHGMQNVAYWVPSQGPEAETSLYYILSHKNREAARASWAGFLADPDWKQVAADSAAKHGKILAVNPAATYMTSTDYSPVIGPIDPAKAYELRTYVAAPGKFDALNARFRDHTDKLFARHGIKSLGYWIPTDEPASKTTLIYLLQHDSREAAAANWKKFRDDPEWQAAKKASEKDGGLLAEPPGVLFLTATDYTPKAKP